MVQPGTESKPIRERLLPQTSIRFFALLIAASAITMYIFREAFLGDRLWAMILSMLITTAMVCFVAYASLFIIANLFSNVVRMLFRPWLRQGSGSKSESGEVDRSGA